MDGLSRSSTARRVRARATRAALVAVIAAIGLLASPGTALAVGEVTPVLDCVRKNTDGTYTYTVTAVYKSWTARSAASTDPVTVSHPTQLAFTVQPSTIVAGSTISDSASR